MIVVGPTLASEALLASTNVTDKVAPMHALGIELRTTLVTTLLVDVHATVMPLSEPQELTLAVAAWTFLELAPVDAAPALPGMARAAAVTIANFALNRMTAYPVMATDTPVTAEAATLLALKSGDAAPVPSRVPVISPSEAFAAPVSVTL